MRRRWSNGGKALVLLLVSIAALAATWFAARIPWFPITLFIVALTWMMVGIQLANVRWAASHPDPPGAWPTGRARRPRRPAPPRGLVWSPVRPAAPGDCRVLGPGRTGC